MSDLSSLIPHQGAMCLLERIVEHDDASITLATTSHRQPDNPLRANGRLRAVHLCEYGAQAMAVHGALRMKKGMKMADEEGGHSSTTSRGMSPFFIRPSSSRPSSSRPSSGMLVSLRAVTFARNYIDDLPGELFVRAQCLQATEASLQYQFSIEHEGEVIASGRAAVMFRR